MVHKLLIIAAAAIFAVALGNRCHVSDDGDRLGCGNATDMTCSSAEYTPYCHKTYSSSTQNGVCTCERLCFTDDECATGCFSRYHGVCNEAYTNSIEKLCVCVRN